MKSSLLAAVTVIASVFAQDKAEAHCPDECCPMQCTSENLMIAAELLSSNWCSIVDAKSLNQLQGLVTSDSQLQVIMQDSQQCIGTGLVDYLDNMINLMPDLGCPEPVAISAVFMQGKNKVVVLGSSLLTVGEEAIVFKIRHVFGVVNGCELKLIESDVIQDECEAV